eukprot:TRINITY_DN3310_c0_g1_i1.p1 TRINITY_DN3310_c0_g1~~TRINITY_DN3310_c0_g1_i1.p1  ORF type:complete len:396 (-),score=78.94 TRINITY_DN3310_c0_g1_i1:24-1211(-)
MKLILVLFALLAIVFAHKHHGHHHGHHHHQHNSDPFFMDKKISSEELTKRIQNLDANKNEKYIECGTNEVYEMKEEIRKKMGIKKEYNSSASPCFNSICDEYSLNQNITNTFRVIDTAVIVVNTNINETRVYEMLNEMNKDYYSSNIGFKLVAMIFVETTFDGNKCIRPYGGNYWYSDIMDIKSKYAFGFGAGQPETLNIFVSCQQSGSSGSLLGIATFPWTADAPLPSGGLWMNEVAFDPAVSTLSHEIGHCLGLWHTFHGVSEVACANTCYEIPHPVDNYNDIQVYNDVGDLAGDTASTPTNYYCFNPTGTDCRTPPIPWTKYGTQPENIMSYARYDQDGKQVKCRRIFSPQQMNRMRCYITNSPISKWLCTGADCSATILPSTNVQVIRRSD